MRLKIVTPEDGNVAGTIVTDENGNELRGLLGVDVRVHIDDGEPFARLEMRLISGCEIDGVEARLVAVHPLTGETAGVERIEFADGSAFIEGRWV